MRKPIVLRIYKGDQLLGVKQFLDEQVVIGRQPEVQVSLNDDTVAIIHAAIEERDGSWYACDLGSETGTYRNGEPILDAQIDSGDILQVGDFRIEFYVGVPKPKAPPPSGTLTQVPVGTVTNVPASQPPELEEPAPKVPDSAPLPVAAAATTKTATSTPTASGSAGAATEEAVDPYKIEAPPVFSADPQAATIRIGGAAAAVGPKILHQELENEKGHGKGKRHGKKTFAPPSKYQSFREFVKPSKGTVVEVLVLWKERVINAFHFSRRAVITMGSHPDCDIVLPVMVSRQRKVPILRIDSRAIVMVTPELTGELIKGQQSSNFSELLRQNRLQKDGNNYALVLDQGEMIRLELSESVSVIIRYTSDSPKPIPAPLLDLTAAEATGIVMAALMVFVVWLYNVLVTPTQDPNEGLNDEPMRTAVIEIEKKKRPPPPPPPPQPQAPPVPTPPPTPPPVVRSTPVPKKVEEQKPKQQQAQSPSPKKTAPAAASNAAPNKNDKNAPRTHTSVKQGGGVKVGDTEGAQAKSQRDVGKSGVFSVFGGSGRQDKLDKSYSGAGELSGFADAASGRAGQNQNRPGEGLGTPFKDTGRGGTGTAAVGVAGVTTKGRGSGVSGFGEGGIGGGRKGVKIVPGGNEESIPTGIDKEAIRRVVQANLRAIKTCYERELNRNPDLFGKLVIEWVIGEQGRVVTARVKSNELGNARVGDCVKGIIRVARFPEPPTSEEVTVAYPFFFSN